jgi:hypothetical protein
MTTGLAGVYHYVPNGFVHVWEELGWKALPALYGTSHGLYSTLMRWEGEGEEKFPEKDAA